LGTFSPNQGQGDRKIQGNDKNQTKEQKWLIAVHGKTTRQKTSDLGGEIPTRPTDFSINKNNEKPRIWPGRKGNTRLEKKKRRIAGEVTEEDFART
jgi:hypothetical protein